MRETLSVWRAHLPSLKHARLAGALGFEVLPSALLYTQFLLGEDYKDFFFNAY